MPIPVTCPGCNAAYALADRQAGKKVRCKKCEAIITVDAAPPEDAAAVEPSGAGAVRVEPPPRFEELPVPADHPDRARHGRDEDVGPRIRRSGGLVTGVILGAAGASLLLLLAGTGVAAFFLFGRAAPTPAANGNAGAPPLPPDPPADAPPDLRADIPVTGVFNAVLYPTSPSPFVAVGGDQGFRGSRVIWDLRTLKQAVVTAAGDDAMPDRVCLSPDGAYFASVPFGGFEGGVDVWVVADGRHIRIDLGGHEGARGVDFAGPGQLLTATMIGPGMKYQVWDIEKGKEVRSFQADGDWECKNWAFSDGRRYVALPALQGERILMFDLTTGQSVGDLPVAGNGFCRGLAFSPDGKSLAALYDLGPHARVQVWDVATKRPAGEHALDERAKDPLGYEGQAIEWLPDGGGWLLYGQTFLDAQSDAVYWSIPNGGRDNSARRLFAGGRVALVKGDGQKKRLVVEELPAEQMAAALKAAREGNGAPPVNNAPPVLPPKPDPQPDAAPPGAAKADPAPDPVAEFPVGGIFTSVVYPTSPGPFVAIARRGEAGGKWEVLDLRRRKSVGVMSFRGDPSPRGWRLSPDGAYFTCQPLFAGGGIDVQAAADDRRLHINVGGPFVRADGLDFAGSGRLLTAIMNGPTNRYQLWDIEKGKELCRFEADGGLESSKDWAFDGDRQRVALPSFQENRIQIFDLTTGRPAGELKAGGGMCHGCAFSPDGKSLAALCEAHGGLHVRVWDLATARLTGQWAADGAPKDPYAYDGCAIEWLPDGGGWLLCGQALMDAQSGAIYWTIPAGPADHSVRRLFADGLVAVVRGDGDKKRLVIETLPAEQIAAALKAARDANAAPLPKSDRPCRRRVLLKLDETITKE